MHKLVKLKKDSNVVYKKTISEYLNPDFVYVPVEKDYQILVKGNESVLKGQIIMENNLKKILSPVSGKIAGIEVKTINGKKYNTIKIENNFEEKEKRNLNKKGIEKTKSGIVSKLYSYYFENIANALSNKNLENLVINAIEDEPYIFTNNLILSKYSKEILELLDILTDVFDLKKTTIALTSNDTSNINLYLSKMGTYPEMELSLLDDKYLIGKNVFLLESLHLKEENTLIIDVKDFIFMHEALKYDKKRLETFLTISGPNVEKSVVYKVKNGTKLTDVLGKVKIKDDSIFILNGLMSGSMIEKDDEIIVNSTKGIIVTSLPNVKEESCNNCGLCVKICPVKINPKKFMDKNEKCKTCLDCGLCSYICPMHINLRKFLRGEK